MHFSLLVLSEYGEIGELLSPYDSNECVEPVIQSTKEELIEEFKRSNNSNFTEEEILEKITEKYGSDLDKNYNLVYYINPKGRWDFYAIGGMWANSVLFTKKRDFDGYFLKNKLPIDEISLRLGSVVSSEVEDCIKIRIDKINSFLYEDEWLSEDDYSSRKDFEDAVREILDDPINRRKTLTVVDCHE